MKWSNSWKSFEEIYPRSSCGVLIRLIDPDNNNPDYQLRYENKLLYGYVYPDCDYIEIIYNITDDNSMLWKVLKDYEKKDVFWLYRAAFEKPE